MTRDELEELESIKFNEKVPLLTDIYVVVDRKKHDSGYRILNIYEGFYVSNAPCTDDLKYKLGLIEDILEEYGIEDLAELKIALDYYNHRYDKVETRRI